MVQIKAKNADGYIINRLVQWDRGVTVYLEHALITEDCAVHFARAGEKKAYAVEGVYSDGVLSAEIPDLLLQTARTIYGYVYAEDGDSGQTIVMFSLGVLARAKPSDVVYSNEDSYISVASSLEDISEQIAAILALLESATAADEDVAEMLEETFA